MSEIEAPEYLSPAAAVEYYKTHQMAQGAAAQLREKAAAGLLQSAPELAGFRTFLAPFEPHTKFLIRPGQVIKAPLHAGVSLGLEPILGRSGDLWVRFTNGVITTDDPDVIDWLEAHAGDPDMHKDYHDLQASVGGVSVAQCKTPIGLCRESGPGIDVWAELVMGQIPLANRPATISPEIDVAAFMRINSGASNKSTLKTGHGARMAETADNNAAARSSRAQGNVR